VKKSIQDNNLDNLDISSKNKFENTNIKTTNINILLNRVRLDKKRTVKKRFIFSTILIAFVSSIAFYFIV
tara:strand:- start:279 stop:488 length:210 start_codon:yes stop_codon:yes gene_type:complete